MKRKRGGKKNERAKDVASSEGGYKGRGKKKQALLISRTCWLLSSIENSSRVFGQEQESRRTNSVVVFFHFTSTGDCSSD